MKYRSTRGSKDNTLNSPSAIIQGLAPDGGPTFVKRYL